MGHLRTDTLPRTKKLSAIVFAVVMTLIKKKFMLLKKSVTDI